MFTCNLRVYFNEFLLALYLFLFTILRIFTSSFPKYSTIILFFGTATLLMISMLYNRLKIQKRFLIYFVIVSLIWLIQIAFLRNDYTLTYFYDFIIYGIISIYFFSYLESYYAFLDYYSTIALVTFLIISIDPLLNYQITGTYMSYGFSILPTFCGVLLGGVIYNKKYYTWFSLIIFAMLLFFGNRSSVISALVFLALVLLLTNKKKKYNLKRILKGVIIVGILTTMGIFIFNNINQILTTFYQYLLSLNFKSYSLATLVRFTETWDFTREASSRNIIQQNAINFIKNHNILIGSGVGSFQDYYGIYSHNLIIDIINSFGFIGLCVISFLTMKTIFKIKTANIYLGITIILMFSVSIIPLMFSTTFIEVSEFWIFILIGLFTINKDFSKSRSKKYKEEWTLQI